MTKKEKIVAAGKRNKISGEIIAGIMSRLVAKIGTARNHSEPTGGNVEKRG